MTKDRQDLSLLERRVIAELLADAATEFEEHSANDWLVPATPANRKLLAEVIARERAEGNDSLKEVQEHQGQYFIFDFWLMRFLSLRFAAGDTLLASELQAAHELFAMLAEDPWEVYDADFPEGRYQVEESEESLALARLVIAETQGELTDDEDGYIGVPLTLLFAFLARRCAEVASRGESAPTGAPPGAPEGARPGVCEKWRKQLKANLKGAAQWFAAQEPDARRDMQYFIEHGYSLTSASLARQGLAPLRQDGMSGARYDLFGSIHQARWEQVLVEHREVDWHAAANAFEAHWLEQHRMAMLWHGHMQANPSRQRNWDGRGIRWAAFGLVATTRHEDVRGLALLLLECARRGYFGSRGGPSTRFLYRIFADVLGVPEVQVEGDSPHRTQDHPALDPIFDALFAVWRAPDPAALAGPAVAACDAHTWHAWFDTAGWQREFDGHSFARTPIAVLLVFRLRQAMGLANPVIDHPMMDDMRPLLAAPLQEAAPDSDLVQVRARMEADGFDARRIRAKLGVA